MTTATSPASLPRTFLFPPQPLSFFHPFHVKGLRCRRRLSTFAAQSLPSSSPAASSSASSPPSSVSTAPGDQPSAHGVDFEKEIARLHALRKRLSMANTLREKLRVVDADDRVRSFFASVRALPSLDLKEEFLVKCVVSAGQGHVLGGELRHGRRHVDGSGLKEAFYGLADMIEGWNMDGFGDEVRKADDCSSGVSDSLKKLLKTLEEVEDFYDCIGGVVG